MEMRSQYKDSQYILSMQKVDLLINSARNMRDKLIIESLYYPALRRFEVAKMKIEDINFSNGRLTVLGKGNKIADVPVGSLFPQYITNLRLFIGNRKKGFVFQTSCTKYTTKEGVRLYKEGKPMTLCRLNQILEKVSDLAGIKNPNPKLRMNKKHEMVKRKVNPHLLRHSLARHLKNLNFGFEFVQNYLRHSKLTTTADAYGTMGIDDLEKMALENRGIIKQSETILIK